MNRICAVINTLNEAENIEACIKSLGSIGQYVDEVLVCDNYSDDDTARIAAECGARVVLYPRVKHVGEARYFACEQAKADWVFFFDADERPSYCLLASLKQWADSNDADVYLFAKKQYLFGKFMMHGGWYEEHFPQFFRRAIYLTADPTIARNIHYDFECLFAKNVRRKTIHKDSGVCVVHYNYDSIEEFVYRTLGRYGTVEAQNRLDAGEAYGWRRMLLLPARQFWRRYVKLKGYKDGMHGFVLALLMGYYKGVIEMNKWYLATQPKNHAEGNGLEVK